MTVVDIDYEVYSCPHCIGYLILRKQFPSDYMPGCSTTLKHSPSSNPEEAYDEPELEKVI